MKVKIYTPMDVRKSRPNFYQSVNLVDIKTNLDDIAKAELIVYKDGYDINVLKSRYGNTGYRFDWYDRKTKNIHRLQQKLLSDILDNGLIVSKLLPSEVYTICRVLSSRAYPVDSVESILLNKLREFYINQPNIYLKEWIS